MEQKKFLDIQGLQHLWNKISMEDYPNNATLVAVIEAINEEIEELKTSPRIQFITWEETD